LARGREEGREGGSDGLVNQSSSPRAKFHPSLPPSLNPSLPSSVLGIYEEKHGGRLSPSATEEEVAVFVSESKAAMLENGLEEGFLSEEELR
jgi:hypothetical protein